MNMPKKSHQKLTKEAEEYIEEIYRLQKRRGVARTSELAEKLDVALGSVTNTIESLERKGYVIHQPYRGVKLTEKGLRIALKILRKHRLAERFLTDMLKMSWIRVHEEACKLEHALTEEVTSKLEEALGNPKVCPHGNPIPTKNGEIKEVPAKPLPHSNLRKLVTVIRITDERNEILELLDTYNIKPGRKLSLIENNYANRYVRVCVGNSDIKLPWKTASAIWVGDVEENV